MANWYYGKNGQKFGPVNTATLKSMASNGELDPSDLIWRDGLPQWVPASQAKGLFPELVPSSELAEVPEETGSATAAAVAPPRVSTAQQYRCASCGGLFSLGSVYNDNGTIVCRTCASERCPPAQQQLPRPPLDYYSPQPDTATYAGFWWRLLALVIDWVIVMVAQLAAGLLLGVAIAIAGAGRHDISLLSNILGIVIPWLYSAILESSSLQGTLGKRALGIIVTDLSGQRIGFGRATGRHFAKIVSSIILCIGFIMAGFTQRKQALHDIIAGTLVMRRQP